VKKLAAGISLAALVMVLAACGGNDAPPPKPVYPSYLNLRGELTINGAQYVRGNLADCAGAARYADLAKGAPVTVSSAAGIPLAVGKILYAVGTNVYQNRLDQCTFRFTVNNVPRSMKGYLLAVAAQPATPVAFLTLVASGGELSINLPTTTTTTSTTFPIPTRKAG
jgi:hypothetical protein